MHLLPESPEGRVKEEKKLRDKPGKKSSLSAGRRRLAQERAGSVCHFGLLQSCGVRNEGGRGKEKKKKKTFL